MARRAWIAVLVVTWLCGARPAAAAAQDREAEFVLQRDRLVKTLRSEGIVDERVLDAVRRVPRHEFVEPRWQTEAYGNYPLPIGHEQTISQPYIVALMTQLLEPKSGDRVLEIGTGSGYQAAVLAELGCRVYTIEIIPELAEGAARVLGRLGYQSVQQLTGDGYLGWPQHAPYDAVIVTAAPEQIPQPLIDQLRSGGRMVIPVGPVGGVQELVLLIKEADGTVRREAVAPVRFVPMVRRQR